MGEAKAKSCHSSHKTSFVIGQRESLGLSPIWLLLEDQVATRAHRAHPTSQGDQFGL